MSTLTMLNHLFLMVLNAAGVSGTAIAVGPTTPIATLSAVSVAPAQSQITLEQALVIANNRVKGDVIEVEFDQGSEKTDDKYEVSIIAQGAEHNVNIDAYTGKVLAVEQKTLDTQDIAEYSAMKQAKISLTQALEQAKQTISGTVVEAEFDGDHGKSDYKIEVVQGAQLHKMVVDSMTGALITNPIKIKNKAV